MARRVRGLRCVRTGVPGREAIFYEDDTPEEWKTLHEANVTFFEEVGSPGGAAQTDVSDRDHPFVAALPPKVEMD